MCRAKQVFFIKSKLNLYLSKVTIYLVFFYISQNYCLNTFLFLENLTCVRINEVCPDYRSYHWVSDYTGLSWDRIKEVTLYYPFNCCYFFFQNIRLCSASKIGRPVRSLAWSRSWVIQSHGSGVLELVASFGGKLPSKKGKYVFSAWA